MQSCCASIDTETSTEKKFRNLALQWGWKSVFANTIRGDKLDYKNKWIRDSYYDESVYCVITKALADCRIQINEFKHARMSNIEIVEFDVKPWELENGYTRANWNAVILWNYIAERYFETILEDNYENEDDCITKIGKKVHDYYENKVNIKSLELIKQSVTDIQAYVKALDLGKEIENRQRHELDPNRPENICTIRMAPWCGPGPEVGSIYLKETPIQLCNRDIIGNSEISIIINSNWKVGSCFVFGWDAVSKINDMLLIEEKEPYTDIFSAEYAKNLLNEKAENWKIKAETTKNKLQYMKDEYLSKLHHGDKDVYEEWSSKVKNESKQYFDVIIKNMERYKNDLISLYNHAYKDDEEAELGCNKLKRLTRKMKEQLSKITNAEQNELYFEITYRYMMNLSIKQYTSMISEIFTKILNDVLYMEDIKAFVNTSKPEKRNNS